jgi:hypothetical protein
VEIPFRGFPLSCLANMALLYERSRLWRRIVAATKDPRILLVFAGSTVVGGTLLAWASQSVTDSSSSDTKKELERLKKRDKETARYAKHSKEALATLFEQVQSGRDSASARIVEESREAGKPAIKFPGIAWHPKAAKREQNRPKDSQSSDD